MRVCSIVLALGLGLFALPAQAVPIQTLPNLLSVTFWERTGGLVPMSHTFAANSSAMQVQLGSPLGPANRDFDTASAEYYDVFYSDADGGLNALGAYVTIEARFDNATDAGHNIAAVQLNFSGGSELADSVASFAAFGAFSFPGLVGNAVDGDLQTHTLMGNTTAASGDRLRLTVGFASSAASSQIPEPAALALFGLGLAGLGLMRRRRETAKHRPETTPI